ncbi:hypothetical protein DRJ19_00210 [Candidatus Woesearchaeota archaeon]|nr:MAG: hypothetical protein DRJ19_00210 [Candidatus Woesearchaeota archaeon]
MLFLEKLFLFVIALLVVAFFTILFTQWAEPFKQLFLFKEDIVSWIELSLLVFVITFVLRQLLIWVWRLEFAPEIREAKMKKYLSKRRRWHG